MARQGGGSDPAPAAEAPEVAAAAGSSKAGPQARHSCRYQQKSILWLGPVQLKARRRNLVPSSLTSASFPPGAPATRSFLRSRRNKELTAEICGSHRAWW
mmetsp:Transcript_85192/g.178037  ORF Transcript_85192/g.178037 Transcript_85192/m.178037 type:complete len:100 (-) Transcript_85192:1286-1585(-)